MAKQLYDVWFVTDVEHVLVEAENKEDALEKARWAPDKFHRQVESYEIYPNYVDPITSEDIQSMYLDMPIYKE